ncbi:hypothetical protein H0H93_001533 [Arthromyces matolae]|nr:hypothetical protein H0H93_001533 [Arthromyces matolae]
MPKGVPRKVKVRSRSNILTGGSKRTSRSLGLRGILEEREQAQERFEANIRGLGKTSLKVLDDLNGTEYASQVPDDMDVEGVPIPSDDQDDTWEDVPHALAIATRDMLSVRHYRDLRTWKQKIERRAENWAQVMEGMVDAYLAWKYPVNVAETPPNDDPNGPANNEPEGLAYDFTIATVDLYTLANSMDIKRSAASPSVASALVANGYMGTSPENPTLALSLRTLDLYHTLRRRKPSFSIDAFSKVICDLYAIPHRRYYRNALSNAFDAYLDMLRLVDRRVLKVLQRDGPNWRVLHACPPCTYELNDEPPLKFSRMFAMDGNNSLKRIGNLGPTRKIADRREFEDSDYFLSNDYVDIFANEVKGRSQASPDADPEADSPNDDTPVPDETSKPTTNLATSINDTPGDPTDGAPDGALQISGCASNWKAAAASTEKKMWPIFDESGIFASACRHGLILWLVDMVKSGELAKYPLAIISMALKVLEPKFLAGFDIGCVFAVTVDRSSLGPQFKERGCRCCVNAFHGYSHNFACQTKNHPNIIEGMGLEDLETMERIFSASNQLASVTRHASKYHRRVFIDLFFRQWDADKYENLGTMLLNNYLQARKIIDDEEHALETTKEHFKIQEGQLERWKAEEIEHFIKLGRESESDIMKTTYVEALKKLREIESKFQNVSTQFLLTPAEASTETYDSALSQTRKRETERRYLSERRDQLTHEVIELEVKLGLERRWLPIDEDYVKAVRYINERNYHRALDKLQKLVIQRLFELHKLNVNQTAYKMRTHIAKSLQARCTAIRNAVTAYNKAAASLDPPRPTLDWSRVSHYSFLEEFNLLQDTRHDIRDQPWADPTTRELMKKDQKIKRAYEEIERLNVEVRRLHTHIIDEHAQFDMLLPTIQKEEPLIYGAAHEFVTYRRRVNAHLLNKILQIHSLPQYSGARVVGVRKGSSSTARDPAVEKPLTVQQEDSTETDSTEEDHEDDDEVTRQVDGMVDFVSNLAL